jgi:Lon protease-like protein
MSAAAPECLPLFPLRTALMPGGQLRLRIFEQRYIDLIGRAIRTGTGFGIPAIRNGNEAGVPATPFDVGTLATITDWDQGKDGLLSVVVEGSRRFRLGAWRTTDSGLLQGDITWLPPAAPFPLTGRHGYLVELLHNLAELVPIVDTGSTVGLGEAERLVYRLSERLPLSLEQHVEILGRDAIEDQLALCEQHVDRLLKRAADSLH